MLNPFLDPSKPHHLYADSSNSELLQDEINFQLCGGTARALSKTRVEPWLRPPPSPEASLVLNYSSPTLPRPLGLDASCATCILQIKKKNDGEHNSSLRPLSHLLCVFQTALMTTVLPIKPLQNIATRLFSSLVLFIIHLFKPPHLLFVQRLGHNSVFHPTTRKRCNYSCSPTFSISYGYAVPFASLLYSPSSFLAFIDSIIPKYVIFFPLKKNPTAMPLCYNTTNHCY